MLSLSCQTAVTGLCYVPPTKVMWVAAGTATPTFIEPKIGVNVRACVRGGTCVCISDCSSHSPPSLPLSLPPSPPSPSLPLV